MRWLWRWLFGRNQPIIYCAKCHAPRDGQRLPSLPAARIVCTGIVDFSMPGEEPRPMCIRLERRLG